MSNQNIPPSLTGFMKNFRAGYTVHNPAHQRNTRFSAHYLCAENRV